MKSKGFTLIELLAVIIILTIIFILIFPSVRNIIDTGKNTIYQKQINTILDAAYDWSLKNINTLPSFGEKIFITLAQLKSNGLIDADIKNAHDKEKFPDNLVISINNVGNNYKNSNEYSRLRSNYLYTLEVELMSTSNYISKKPSIELVGLTPNSDGNYVTTIDLNEIYESADYIATSNEGYDLTKNVVINITYYDKLVDFIDTSKMGIYYIYYTVIDINGYSNTVVRSVIIGDNQKPQIDLPVNNTISAKLTDFDLMDGVSCSDNSGICQISTKGDINLGVKGKYVIEYIAQDPSGNTSTVKRVITIE